MKKGEPYNYVQSDHTYPISIRIYQEKLDYENGIYPETLENRTKPVTSKNYELVWYNTHMEFKEYNASWVVESNDNYYIDNEYIGGVLSGIIEHFMGNPAFYDIFPSSTWTDIFFKPIKGTNLKYNFYRTGIVIVVNDRAYFYNDGEWVYIPDFENLKDVYQYIYTEYMKTVKIPRSTFYKKVVVSQTISTLDYMRYLLEKIEESME